MTFHSVLVTQTVVGVLGLVPSYLLGIASVMSAANGEKHLKLAGFVVGAGLALPVMLAVSLIAMWVAHSYGWERAAMGFVVLPWVHLLVLILGTLALFR